MTAMLKTSNLYVSLVIAITNNFFQKIATHFNYYTQVCYTRKLDSTITIENQSLFYLLNYTSFAGNRMLNGTSCTYWEHTGGYISTKFWNNEAKNVPVKLIKIVSYLTTTTSDYTFDPKDTFVNTDVDAKVFAVPAFCKEQIKEVEDTIFTDDFMVVKKKTQ